MLDFIAKGLAKVFGTKSDRDIKEFLPRVTETNQIFAGLASLSDDQLREKTHSLRARINEQLKAIDDKITDIRGQIEALPAQAVHQKDQLFNQIDALEKERDTELEKRNPKLKTNPTSNKSMKILASVTAILNFIKHPLTQNH
jgi:preprotein translocase subunit SecA